MKSLKKISVVTVLCLVIGFLAGAAFAATTESRIALESGRQGAILALTSTSIPQTSFGNCLGSNCSTSSLTALSRFDGSSASPLNRISAANDSGRLTISGISRLDHSSASPTTIENGVDETSRIAAHSGFTFGKANKEPQLHLTNATLTSQIGSPYLRESGGGFASMVRQLFCSPPAREDCISENLFNSNPAIRTAPTGKLILAPEPTAAFLLGTGLLALGLIRRRQKTDRN